MRSAPTRSTQTASSGRASAPYPRVFGCLLLTPSPPKQKQYLRTSYINDNKAKQLEEQQAEVASLEARLAEVDHSIDVVDQILETARIDMSNQSVKEREITDNISLRRTQREIDDCRRREAKMEEELQGLH